MRSFSFFIAFILLGSVAACGSKDVARGDGENPGAKPGGGGGGTGQGAGGGGSDPNSGFIPECDPQDPTSDCAEVAGVCGDGILTDDEACDDGNVAGEDGCAANCLTLEVGYSCAKPGEACRKIARCGDGLQVFPEHCDDGNKDPGDGCSATCKVEIGFKCDGAVCEPTVCGDGVQEGAESCDDGNAQPFDGCSVICQTEPDCSAGACTSECGDGLVLGEECDDGNLIDGDGCSSTCTIEGGFECNQDDNCEMINGECVLRVSSIFRDFTNAHADFQVNCAGTETVADMVEPALVDGRPKLVLPPKACVTSEDSFDEWYTDGPGRTTVVGSIVLFSDGAGGFVNRYGEMGEKWISYADQDYNCAADCVPCSTNPMQMCTAGTVVEWDGNPLFFPLDGETATEERFPAKVPEQYGWNGWPWEYQVFPPTMPEHNFYFTTEVKYWFSYDDATDATLTFTGDDDVWVFVNGVLAADLGGVHAPVTEAVPINATTAATYNLAPDNAYQVSVFHAERKQEGSSFQLTLDGFSSARSECRPVCGDGMVGLGEECDDGVNDGGYGECAPECVLGPHCGDGILQADQGEDCDDGNNVDGDECPSACRILKVRNN